MCRSRDREKKTPTDIIIRTEHWKETTAEKYKRGKLFWFLLGECRESERERRVRQAFDVIIAGLVKAADNHGREEDEEEEPEGVRRKKERKEIEIKANNRKGWREKMMITTTLHFVLLFSFLFCYSFSLRYLFWYYSRNKTGGEKKKEI
jgi:hypothetical protein